MQRKRSWIPSFKIAPRKIKYLGIKLIKVKDFYKKKTIKFLKNKIEKCIRKSIDIACLWIGTIV